MKSIYLLFLCIGLIAVNIYGIRLRKVDSPLSKALFATMNAVNCAVITSMLAMLLPNERAALIMQCLHYVFTEWILILLLRFLEIYVGNIVSNTFSRSAVIGLAVLSSINLLLNDGFHHIVQCSYKEVDGTMFRIFENMGAGYRIHEYFCYTLALFSLVTLLYATYRSTSFYRRRYYPAAIALICIFFVEGICAMDQYPVDYALYGYLIMVVFLIYYSVYYVHKSLIASTLSYVVTDSRNGVICFDIDDKCIYANEEAKNLYPEVKTLEDFEGIFREQVQGRAFSQVEDGKWNASFQGEQGRLHYEVAFGKLLDRKNEYIGCCFYLHDRTRDVENYEKERYRATHDALTDLYNREYFGERVRRILKHNPEESYYIICTDIKDFKLINDLFGFEKGNEILVEFARLMKESLPKGSACGRFNSDRFAFCVAKEDYSEEIILSNIRQVVQMIESTEYHLHIHVGVYQVAEKDEAVSVMCDHARMALRLIKDDYQKTFAYYDDIIMQQILREKHLVGEFENALDTEQFEMYLQPQVNPDGRVMGAEALVRWKHPEEGLISPGEFIRVFENSGLIYKLDLYMWEMAAAKLQEWKKQGKEQYYISVNISAKDFYYLDIYKIFTALVERYEIEPEKLKLEITESALMHEADKQLALLERLQEYGFHVEIDDFGSGYSSLNMLKDMRADVLKIDMGFLRETEEKERTKTILNMVVDLAKNLKMIVISEGVESREQVEYLTRVGCDMFQGYYFERPIPVAEFEQRYLYQAG